MKEGSTVKLIHAPAHYKALPGEAYDSLNIKNKATADIDIIHLFINSVKELKQQLPPAERTNKKGWRHMGIVVKKSAGKPTELTENTIRDSALATGLVDVKVCAVDEEWSA